MVQLDPKMCGITGIYTFSKPATAQAESVKNAVARLNHRGPDFQAVFQHTNVGLGHARLSIIDTSEAANQPFTDANGRYTIAFNGEIYNYRDLRKTLEAKGVQFKTSSDTEVLLQLFIAHGEACLSQLNGFFAFAIYDAETAQLFAARDRMGIKPLLIYSDGERFVFGSEMKAVLEYGVPKKINYTALYTYLQLNYIPAPQTIFENVTKLMPGSCVLLTPTSIEIRPYYEIPHDRNYNKIDSYEQAQSALREEMHKAVELRMVSDVPLGSFLSGGTDSSIIAAIASKYTDKLKTFSVGYADEPFYDETEYARQVAKKIGSEHTVFSLTNKDLYDHLHSILDHIDEPFADSSAIAVNILSKNTRKEVTVALSGDGADEMFSGYNKHHAEFKVRQKSLASKVVKAGAPLWKLMPKSRQSKVGNLGRQLDRFASGMKLPAAERYWSWASFMQADQAKRLLNVEWDQDVFDQAQAEILHKIKDEGDFNDVLYTDMQLVLPNDMLTKVDLMSMAHSLEVRTPFLDHNVVELAFAMQESYKINGQMRKRVLQDAFRDDLPESLYNRSKKGFEVPLHKWFQEELSDLIHNDLLADDFIVDQGIFNVAEVQHLKRQLLSANPGDATLNVWALVVFQNWFKQYC